MNKKLLLKPILIFSLMLLPMCVAVGAIVKYVHAPAVGAEYAAPPSEPTTVW